MKGKKILGVILIAIPVIAYFGGALISLGPEGWLRLLGFWMLTFVGAGIIIKGMKLLGK